MLRPFCLCIALAIALSGISKAAIFGCTETAVPPVVKGEGIAERTGDILLNCSGGQPGATLTGNLSIFLDVNITNRVTSNNTVTDIDFTVDNGAGPQPVNAPGIITGPGTLIYNKLIFQLSDTGSATLRIANIRAAANQLNLAPNTAIQAFLGFNSNLISFTTGQFSIGTPVRGLYAGFSTSLICSSHGSALPSDVHSLISFFSSSAAFSSTRVTEGFADAFAQRSAWESLHADAGTRILVTYSGFPAGAQLFVPDVVAGSDALTPTAAGDLGVPKSGGRYVPSLAGSLLLARVQGANSSGAGGAPVYTPGPVGSAAVSFDAMNPVTLTNGTGVAVYEVVDANPTVQESAQFPTFLGLAPFSGDPVITSEVVSLAAQSSVMIASKTDPIPRFVDLAAPNDCQIIGDCGAFYYPKLTVNTTPLEFTATSGGAFQVAYAQINNKGGGHLVWAATVTYAKGSGWLRLDPADGVDNATLRVDALPTNLEPGTYTATITVDAGPQAGAMTIPVTFVVTAGTPPPPVPTVAAVVNAATFTTAAAVPGSIVTILGDHLKGTHVVVQFDGSAGDILFDGDKQINLVVPAALGKKPSAQLIVIVDGNQSVAQTVPLAEFGPVIFGSGVLNQDGQINGDSHPATLPSILQIFATGLSGNGDITARVNGAVIDPPTFGGPAPGLKGVQQINVQLPGDLTGPTADVAVCGGPAGKPDQAVCSPVVKVTLAH